MALQRLVGQGLWVPPNPFGTVGGGTFSATDAALLDAGGEEYQIIGAVSIEGGGSATFGTSSSISWLPGSSITFASGSTLRMGIKTAISTTAGPPARATYGTAAFDVYKDLVGGTDTITSTTARTDTMASGTPFTVTDGDLIAICFYLTSSSGTPAVKLRQSLQPVATGGLPAHTLITAAGATFTAQQLVANVVIAFNDGSAGWIDQTISFSTAQATSGTIGITNIKGNIFRVPFPCSLKSISAILAVAGDFSLDLYSTPLGTPFKEGEILCDANVAANASGRLYSRRFPTSITLAANTDYLIGVRQTSASAQTIIQNDVAVAAHWQPWGMGPECYAADSVAGATFAAVNSGLRRYSIYAMIIFLDDGAGGGGGLGISQGLHSIGSQISA